MLKRSRFRAGILECRVPCSISFLSVLSLLLCYPVLSDPGSNLVLVPGGCFQMGSAKLSGSEKPVHRVCIDTFYLEKSEVAQKSYLNKTKKKHVFSRKDCETCPADYVSWYEANEYCQSVGRRLPSEAEWEYALKMGGGERLFQSDSLLKKTAWYRQNARDQSHEVASKNPNSLGIYDMQGNVWEWCADWYSGNYYNIADTFNPKGPDKGNVKVLRGGSYLNSKKMLAPAFRFRRKPLEKDLNIGFRCAKDYPAPR